MDISLSRGGREVKINILFIKYLLCYTIFNVYRLFFGDETDRFTKHPITVRTIRIIDDGSNLQQQVEAITKFDEILTCGAHWTPGVLAESEYGTIIKNSKK